MQPNSPITEQRFRRLVRKLTAHQLRRFPVRYLPASVPLDAVDADAEPAKWAALEALSWTAGRRDRAEQGSDDAQPDDDFRQAVDTAESATAEGAAALDQLCDALGSGWRGQDIERDPLSEASQTLESARSQAAELGDRVAALNCALGVIDQGCGGGNGLQARVGAAREHAREALSRLESVLGRFHLVQLDIARGALRTKEVELEEQFRRIHDLEERIAGVEARLEKQNGLVARVFRPKLARQQREHLLQRLQMLTAKRDSAEVSIGEQYLLHWIDIVVNAALYTDPDQWRQRGRHARLLLYRLLNTYCRQQERAARRVATRPPPGMHANEAAAYYRKSEQFILSYFAGKHHEVTLWLAGAADAKLRRLDDTRDAILAEYRRRARARGATAPSRARDDAAEPLSAVG